MQWRLRIILVQRRSPLLAMSGIELAFGLPGVADFVFRLCRTVIERCRKARANRLFCMQLAIRVQRLQEILLQHTHKKIHSESTVPKPDTCLGNTLSDLRRLLEEKALPLLEKLSRKTEKPRKASFPVWARSVKDGDKVDQDLRHLARYIDALALDVSFSLTSSLHMLRSSDHDAVMKELGDVKRRFVILEKIFAESKASPIGITANQIRRIIKKSIRSQIKSLVSATEQSALITGRHSEELVETDLHTIGEYSQIWSSTQPTSVTPVEVLESDDYV